MTCTCAQTLAATPFAALALLHPPPSSTVWSHTPHNPHCTVSSSSCVSFRVLTCYTYFILFPHWMCCTWWQVTVSVSSRSGKRLVTFMRTRQVVFVTRSRNVLPRVCVRALPPSPLPPSLGVIFPFVFPNTPANCRAHRTRTNALVHSIVICRRTL